MPRRARAALGLAVAALALGTSGARAQEAIRVICTLPHLASIASEVGGERVEVTALASGHVDPHLVIPTPGLMAEAQAADLYLEVGMGLELWSERVLDGARNPDIRVGAPGHAYVFEGVQRLQVPAVVSRAQGDVHPLGNPHIWLDPMEVKVVAGNVAAALKRVDGASAAAYDANLARFCARVDRAYFGDALVEVLGADLLTRLQRSGKLFGFLAERELRGKPLSDMVGGWLGVLWKHRGTPFVAHHQTWAYFARAFDLREVGWLEPKPGIPPTPGHLSDLEGRARAAGVKVVLIAPFHDFRRAASFAERVGGTAVGLPTEPGMDGIDGWFGLMDALVERFAAAAEGGS